MVIVLGVRHRRLRFLILLVIGVMVVMLNVAVMSFMTRLPGVVIMMVSRWVALPGAKANVIITKGKLFCVGKGGRTTKFDLKGSVSFESSDESLDKVSLIDVRQKKEEPLEFGDVFMDRATLL